MGRRRTAKVTFWAPDDESGYDDKHFIKILTWAERNGGWFDGAFNQRKGMEYCVFLFSTDEAAVEFVAMLSKVRVYERVKLERTIKR